jgi:Meckel syndrome type 1 protein
MKDTRNPDPEDALDPRMSIKKAPTFEEYMREQAARRAGKSAPSAQPTQSKHIGSGGMSDTRNPDPEDHPDPRMSVRKAPTFEEYMREQAARQNKGSSGPSQASSSRPAEPKSESKSDSGGKPFSSSDYMSRLSAPRSTESKAEKHVGSGGMSDTRNPDPEDHPDPRMSIRKAPTFEEYMREQAARRGQK